MLPLRHRLHLRAHPDFFSQEHRSSSRLVMVYALPTPEFSAAVIVPKKAGLTAVGRNQLKRRVHAFLTHHRTQLLGQIAIVVHLPALHASATELETDLVHHLRRLQMWRED